MKLEHLREFVVLSQCGNFREAAKKLFISQPALSNHIRALEEETGFLLLDRDKGNCLTSAGLIFLESAQTALHSLDNGLAEGRKVAQLHSAGNPPAKVAVRTLFDSSRKVLAAACPGAYELVGYQERRPLLYCFSQNTTDVMTIYDLDLLPELKDEAESQGLASIPLTSDTCSIAIKKGHPLAGMPLTRQALKGAHFVILSANEFKYWNAIIRNILGSDLGLDVSIIPVDNILNLEIVDLQDKILLCLTRMINLYFAHRGEYEIHHEVDGLPLTLGSSLLYRPNTGNSNIDAVVKALSKSLGRE